MHSDCQITQAGWCGLAFGIAFQFWLIAASPVSPGLGGDEFDYIGKSDRLIHRGTLCADAPATVASAGTRSYSDFRPPGLPILFAMIGVDLKNHALYRKPIAFAYVIGMAPILAYVVSLAGLRVHRVRQFLLALIVSTFPPLFEGCLRFYPDQICAILTAYGLYFVSVGVVSRAVGGYWILLGSTILAITSTIRPELITTIPTVGVALLFASLIRHRSYADLNPIPLLTAGRIACLFLPLVASTGLNAAYRWSCFHELRIYGRQEIPCPGVEAWCRTWLNSESECLAQIAWPLGHPNPKVKVESISGRAFANEEERTEVSVLLSEATRVGLLSAKADEQFGDLATRRIASNYWEHLVVPRAWRPIHLWLNLETNKQTLEALSSLPRFVRQPLIGWWICLKLIFIARFVYGCWNVCRIPLLASPTMRDFFPLLGFALVIARTLLIGVLLGLHEHRYATVAWPLCIAVAVYTASNKNRIEHSQLQPDTPLCGHGVTPQ